MKAVKGEEIFLCAENKKGTLETASKVLSDARVNIRALSAYVVENQAYFRFVTSETAKAKEILKKIGTVQIKEIIIVELADEVGKLASFSECLYKAGIDIRYIYGSTNQPQKTAILVMSCDNNDEALATLVAQ